MSLFSSETVTFETPIAMLVACHDRVRQYAALTLKLAQYLIKEGADTKAQDAAAGILRYFDVAAPLHHNDEDLDLFPLLSQYGNAELKAIIASTSAEHKTLGLLWQDVRSYLIPLAAGQGGKLPLALASEFSKRYPAHADLEETLIYPSAELLLDASTLSAMGQNMTNRRIQNTAQDKTL
ncbi:hemerythrin domain-containing protein [Iodobacter ciconiae]|uniref:Hemerythrin domain-containing protein n=1 Tax=Iodobacter ciconiae TaxID=2496266 RepID=A0A3S8ZV75_9NEIS|nr:hemerythrin domain-containing protein [Iodobacter ciconiae]AZN37361.1 hemerythrin domain-containing protein [Iodobacter ciconiae]